MILHCYVDDATYSLLLKASSELQKTVEDLAESAIAESILDWAKKNDKLPR